MLAIPALEFDDVLKLLAPEGSSTDVLYSQDDDSSFGHQGVPGTKWGVRKWQNKDGSYTPAGLNDKPGGRYNQHSGEGTPWGEGQDDYSGQKSQADDTYKDKKRYHYITNAQAEKIKDHGIKTAVAAGVVGASAYGIHSLKELDASTGGAISAGVKKAFQYAQSAKKTPAGAFLLMTESAIPAVADAINNATGKTAAALRSDDPVFNATPVSPSTLLRGQVIEPGTKFWRMGSFSPADPASLARKSYVTFDEADANFYAAFGNGLAKEADTVARPVVSWEHTATQKLYIADSTTVIKDVIESFTDPNSYMGKVDRAAFNVNGNTPKPVRWVARYLLGGTQDVQKRWVGQHGQIIEKYANAGYNGMSDLTDYFGGMAQQPVILFGTPDGGTAPFTVEARNVPVEQDILKGQAFAVATMPSQKVSTKKGQIRDEILRLINAPSTAATMDRADAATPKGFGSLARVSYDVQNANRKLGLKFGDITESGKTNMAKWGDWFTEDADGSNRVFHTNATPSRSATIRKRNSAAAAARMDIANRNILNYNYTGRRTVAYDAETTILKGSGQQAYYSLIDGTKVKQSTYNSLRQQAVDYLYEHPNSKYTVNELMGLMYNWGK